MLIFVVVFFWNRRLEHGCGTFWDWVFFHWQLFIWFWQRNGWRNLTRLSSILFHPEWQLLLIVFSGYLNNLKPCVSFFRVLTLSLLFWMIHWWFFRFKRIILPVYLGIFLVVELGNLLFKIINRIPFNLWETEKEKGILICEWCLVSFMGSCSFARSSHSSIISLWWSQLHSFHLESS
jgi:hypothetical protein